jgi:hypothetical protein
MAAIASQRFTHQRRQLPVESTQIAGSANGLPRFFEAGLQLIEDGDEIGNCLFERIGRTCAAKRDKATDLGLFQGQRYAGDDIGDRIGRSVELDAIDADNCIRCRL